jgi:hypothetical protein
MPAPYIIPVPETEPFANAGTRTVPTGGFLTNGYPQNSLVSREHLNWLANKASNHAGYYVQWGAPEWVSTTTYAVGALVRDSATNTFHRLISAPAAGTAPHVDVANWVECNAPSRARSGQFAEETMAFRDAGGRRRFRVDHYGFPGGRMVVSTEDWSARQFAFQSVLGSGTFGNAWGYTLFGPGAPNVSPGTASSLYPFSRYAQLEVNAGTSANGVHIERAGCPVHHPNLVFWMEADWTIPPSGTDFTNNEFSFGFAGQTLAGTSGLLNNNNPAACFLKVPGTNNLQLYTMRTSDVSPVITATSIPFNNGTRRRLRVEYVGPSVADDGTEAIRFFVDGAFVSGVAETMPAFQQIFPFARAWHQAAAGGTLMDLWVGPVAIGWNLYAGDVV